MAFRVVLGKPRFVRLVSLSEFNPRLLRRWRNCNRCAGLGGRVADLQNERNRSSDWRGSRHDNVNLQQSGDRFGRGTGVCYWRVHPSDRHTDREHGLFPILMRDRACNARRHRLTFAGRVDLDCRTARGGVRWIIDRVVLVAAPTQVPCRTNPL